MLVDRQEPPWRVVRAFAQDRGGTLVHLHNVSGGVLAGDRLTLDVEVAAGCPVQLTTTGATRVYRHRPGSDMSVQEVNIRVAPDAVLDYLPDALIPFAGSRHFQKTTVSLSDGATMFWWETLAPGRQAMGEVFALERLRLRSEVRSPSRPLLIDDFTIEPAVRSPASPARMGAYTHTAAFYVFSVGLPASKWADLIGTIDNFCSARSRPGVIIWGTSTLAADGIAVRGLSNSARELPATLAALWKIARKFLTGEDAVLPRKVY